MDLQVLRGVAPRVLGLRLPPLLLQLGLLPPPALVHLQPRAVRSLLKNTPCCLSFVTIHTKHSALPLGYSAARGQCACSLSRSAFARPAWPWAAESFRRPSLYFTGGEIQLIISVFP